MYTENAKDVPNMSLENDEEEAQLFSPQYFIRRNIAPNMNIINWFRRTFMEVDETIRERVHVNFTFEIGELLAETLKAIFTPPVVPKPEEIKIMANFIVKDDNSDVGVKVTATGVTDSEGQAIDNAQLTIKITSTDDNVVQVTDNGDGSGNVHFGAPGQASTQYEVSDASGKVLGSGSDGFTVTVGDPAAIANISASFDGLTPVDETPAPGPVEEPPVV